MNQNFLSASKIVKGLAIYVILSIVAAIVETIGAWSAVADLANGDLSGLVMFDFYDIFGLICSVGVIYGLFVYYGGLKALSTGLDAVGNKAVGNIAMAILLTLIAELISIIGIFVPFLGIISAILLIIALILNIMGYANLQKSGALSPLGVAGAKKLFLGYIFGLIGSFFAFIPFLGIIALVFNILYWVFLFQGWGKIKASFNA
ncbi:MAG: hypothetical protein R3Y49_03595 [Rikenellaceae bacterium]